jgi:hypothetical protein
MPSGQIEKLGESSILSKECSAIVTQPISLSLSFRKLTSQLHIKVTDYMNYTLQLYQVPIL